MSRKVVVLVFHGIGTYRSAFLEPKTRFDRPLWDGLYRRLGEALRTDVVWVPILWSLADLEAYEAELVGDRAEWEGLFGFVASALCDASAYQLIGEKHPSYRRSNYYRVQRTVHDALAGAEAQIVEAGQDPAETPILAVCHSMGCHILSSYAWDVQNRPSRVLNRRGDRKTSPFATLDCLASAIFTGCNLPLLTAGVPRTEKVPLKIVYDPARWGRGQRWLNFYDPDDLLGYPLEAEYESYWTGQHPKQAELLAELGRDPSQEVAVQDNRYELKGPMGLPSPAAMTPLVHNRYWQSSEVLASIERAIRDLL